MRKYVCNATRSVVLSIVVLTVGCHFSSKHQYPPPTENSNSVVSAQLDDGVKFVGKSNSTAAIHTKNLRLLGRSRKVTKIEMGDDVVTVRNREMQINGGKPIRIPKDAKQIIADNTADLTVTIDGTRIR